MRISTGIIALCLELNDLLSSHYRSYRKGVQRPVGHVHYTGGGKHGLGCSNTCPQSLLNYKVLPEKHSNTNALYFKCICLDCPKCDSRPDRVVWAFWLLDQTLVSATSVIDEVAVSALHKGFMSKDKSEMQWVPTQFAKNVMAEPYPLFSAVMLSHLNR